MVWLVVFFGGSALASGIIASQGPLSTLRDSASVLAFVSLAAVAIERIIEGAFTMLAGRLGQWWPLKVIKDEFDTFETQTNALLGPVVATTLQELQAAKAAAVSGSAEAVRLQGLIDGIDARRARLQNQLTDVTTKLPPGSDRLARVGEINAAMAAALQTAHDESRAAMTDAKQSLQTASDLSDRASLIISSFQDNPARRLASLLIGMSLGMLLASAIGLNLFVATLVASDGSTADLPKLVAGAFGVILTGIVIGLGSAPTHEVVKSLQAYKDGRIAPVGVATLATGAGAGTGGRSMAISNGVVLEGAAPAGPGVQPATIVVRDVRRSG